MNVEFRSQILLLLSHTILLAQRTILFYSCSEQKIFLFFFQPDFKVGLHRYMIFERVLRVFRT